MDRPFFWPHLPKAKKKRGPTRKPPYRRGGDKRISKPLFRQKPANSA